MIRRRYVAALVVAILWAAAAVPAFAQGAELRGQVLIQRADGQRVPLAGAQIDIFRTDVKATFAAKTNEKGAFVVSLPFAGTYTVAASHPTAAPNLVRGIRAGRDPVEIVVTPGNGRRITVEDLTAVAAANTKITETNAALSRAFTTGNDALSAATTASRGNNSDLAIAKYTEAVAQFDQGLAVDPEQSALLTNKAVALKGRGVERFNATRRSKTLTDSARAAALAAAKADFTAAVNVSTKAVAMLKARATPADPDDLRLHNSNRYAALLTRAESMRLLVINVDTAQADAGLAAFKEYIAVETDAAKKATAQLDAAQMLLDAGSVDKAIVEFRTVLATRPDNPEANLGMGMALLGTGDKTRLQDAANYLQRFVDVAPDNHPLKVTAKSSLDFLKSEKIVPKATPPAPNRSRP